MAVLKKKKISSIQKQVNFVVFRWVCVKRFQASVNFKNAEDVRRGWRIAHSVESEGGARDGLQLRAFVQSQEAGHLAGLQEVERVRPGGGGRAVALHALQLLRPRADGHHIQLHILRLLLIEQHLRRQRGWSTSHEDESSDTRELVSSQLFKWKLGPRSCYHNFFPPLFFFCWLDFFQTSLNLTRPKSGYMRLAETWYPPLQITWYVPVQYYWGLCKVKAKLKSEAASRDCWFTQVANMKSIQSFSTTSPQEAKFKSKIFFLYLDSF